MSEAKIRSAGPGDGEAIHRLIVALAEYEREKDAVLSTVADIEADLALQRPPFECLLLELSGQAVGFALFFHNYSTWRGKKGLYLEDLFIQPDQRGRGFGKALLQSLAKIAVERDCARMEWSVLDWNRPAIEFYEGLGAKLLEGWSICRLTDDALKGLAEQS